RMRIMNSDKRHYDVSDVDLGLTKPRAERIPEPSISTGMHASNVDESERPHPSEPAVMAASPPFTNAPWRKLQALRDRFYEHTSLSPKEITRLLKISDSTADRYCKTLMQAGFIERVSPSKSPRSRYYTLKAS